MGALNNTETYYIWNLPQEMHMLVQQIKKWETSDHCTRQYMANDLRILKTVTWLGKENEVGKM